VKQQAVTLSRQAYRLDPDTNRINLAKHLFSFGMSLDKVKDHRSACAAKKEAIDLLRDGQKCSGRLIKYLEGYGKTLNRAGRGDDASAVAQEASRLRSMEGANSDEGTYQVESAYSCSGS